MLKILMLYTNPDNNVILHDLFKLTFPDVDFYSVKEFDVFVDVAAKNDMDVFFIELEIPFKKNLKQFQQLKKGSKTKHIPVVLFGNSDVDIKISRNAFDAGFDFVLSKTVNEYEFAILIKTMLKIKNFNIENSAKNELKLKIERADNIIEGTNAGTWDWDIKSGKMIINNRWAEMIGYSVKELKPITIKTWKLKVHPKDLKTADHKIKLHFKKLIKYYYAEFRLRHKNGNWVWINSRGKVVEWSEDGTPVRMAGTHIDITHKKTVERELIKAKEKAEQSDKLKSAFLSNMSHEIRTPMNGILGFIELLENPDLTTEEQSRFIGIVKKSGKRLLNTINDIIEFSKIEAGETPLHITKTNINILLQSIYAFFKPQAESKDLTLNLIIDESNKKVIANTDENKLESIIINLVKNAIKFTTIGSIEFGYNIVNSKISFFVKDTGKGIEANKLNSIFERFIQANLKINRGHEGSGLGLSIAKAYTQMLGGEIWVESELNVGSAFQFTIKYEPAEIKKLIIEKKPVFFSKEETYENSQILVAEDEEFNFLLIEQILKPLNLDILRAKDGIETIEICKNNPNISLILMDIKMPLMDGHTAAKQIKKFRKNLPMIAQSAFALDYELEEFNRVFDEYIKKPINQDELNLKVRKFITKTNISPLNQVYG